MTTTKKMTTTRKIKTETLFRSVVINTREIDQENRTVEIAFSSEEPVDRYFGKEILDHALKSIRLGRLKDGGPVLVDHNPSDHVGVVESVSVDKDRRGRAVVRFGNSERASEIFQDVVDGIRKSISVGYRIIKAVLEETGDEEPDVYRITDWEPLEISIVSIPADASVGVGRNADTEHELEIEIPKQEERKMGDKVEDKNTPAGTETVDVRAIENKAVKAEQTRVSDLLAAGEQYKAEDLAREFVGNGGNVNDFNKAVLERMGKPDAIEAEAPDIGLTEREADKFSFVRALNVLANPNDKRAIDAAGFELECSSAAAERTQKDVKGIMVPIDVLKRVMGGGQRDLSVGTTTAGGHTVATDLLSGSFIEMLRARAVMMGISTVMTDLNGNIAIPRQTGGATGYWVAEAGAPTESQQAFDQVTLSPKTVGAFTDYSRKLLLQSSIDVEAFVRGDLARTLALEIDRAAINGSGASNEPTGILNATGIGDVAGGTNGLAPAWDHIVDLETEVAIDNADLGFLRYLTNAKVRGKTKKTFVDSGSNAERVWDTRAGNTPLNGYETLVTNQVPSDLDKGTSTGVCSAIIFGNFADLLIGMWGGLDLTVDPFTASTTGSVRIVALQDMDLAVRHPESFAAMQDALTV